MYKVQHCRNKKSLNNYEVYYEDDNHNVVICEIPHYHTDSESIANLIAKLLNNKKYKLELFK